MEGLEVTDLADRYGTPLYVYSRKVLEQKLTLLRGALPEAFNVYYSVKANPNPKVISFLVRQGCGLEVASGGELEKALQSGCAAGKILFAGPGKTEPELELALMKGIGELHVESLRELERISRIGARLGVKARVAIRVNPLGEVAGGAMLMGGKPAPFGIDEERLEQVLGSVLSNPSIEFRGIHLFVGTQILDTTVLLSQYRKALEIARWAVQLAGRPLATLDFGGGFGIPYFSDEQELDLELLEIGLDRLMQEIRCDRAFQGTQFVVEPGRYLVGECGIYIARVNDIKVSRGKKYLILDGGMHHHLAASGNLGQIIKRNFPVALLNRLDEPASDIVDVVGPLCTPLDMLARQVRLPSAQVGDLFGIFQSGAYARSASPLHFLSHPEPPEVWVDAGEVRLTTE